MMKLLILLLASLSLSQAQELDCPPEKTLADKLSHKIPRKSLSHWGYVSNDELRTLSSREIAEAIVSSLSVQCDPASTDPKAKALSVDAEIMMFVPSGALGGIIKYGFQNQHVTRTTKGSDAREQRFTTEANLVGTLVGHGPKGKEILPKYSALNFQNLAKKSFLITPDAYGDLIMVMKEEVKKRTTWTKLDSLNLQEPGQTLNLKVSPTQPIICSGYCESQIWGSLDLTDVDSIIIKDPAQLTEELKATGLTIYTREKDTSSVKLKKGALVWKGSGKVPTPAPLPSDDDLKNLAPNHVVRNIVEHKRLETMDAPTLMEKFSQTREPQSQREILGQISLTTSPEVKEFLMKSYQKNPDNLSKMQIIQGLSSYLNDGKVQNFILKAMEEESNKQEWDDHSLKIALIVIGSELKLKDRKKLDAVLSKLGSLYGKESWYNRAIKKAQLCPTEKPGM